MIVHRASSLSVGSLLSICTDYFVHLFRSSCLSLQTLLTICTEFLVYLYRPPWLFIRTSCLSVRTILFVYANHFVSQAGLSCPLYRPSCLSVRALFSICLCYFSLWNLFSFCMQHLVCLYGSSFLYVRNILSVCTEILCLYGTTCLSARNIPPPPPLYLVVVPLSACVFVFPPRCLHTALLQLRCLKNLISGGHPKRGSQTMAAISLKRVVDCDIFDRLLKLWDAPGAWQARRDTCKNAWGCSWQWLRDGQIDWVTDKIRWVQGQPRCWLGAVITQAWFSMTCDGAMWKPCWKANNPGWIGGWF